MVTLRSLLRPLALLCAVALLNSCFFYKKVVFPPDSPPPIEGKRVILHWQHYQYVMRQPLLRQDTLEGGMTKISQQMAMAQRGRVDLYIAADYDLAAALSADRSAIPLDVIQRVSVQQVVAGRTVLTAGGIVLAAGGFILTVRSFIPDWSFDLSR